MKIDRLGVSQIGFGRWAHGSKLVIQRDLSYNLGQDKLGSEEIIRIANKLAKDKNFIYEIEDGGINAISVYDASKKIDVLNPIFRSTNNGGFQGGNTYNSILPILQKAEVFHDKMSEKIFRQKFNDVCAKYAYRETRGVADALRAIDDILEFKN